MTVLELFTVIVILAVIGFAVWLVTTYIPMPDPIKKAIVVVVVLFILLWVVRGLVSGSFGFPRVSLAPPGELAVQGALWQP